MENCDKSEKLQLQLRAAGIPEEQQPETMAVLGGWLDFEKIMKLWVLFKDEWPTVLRIVRALRDIFGSQPLPPFLPTPPAPAPDPFVP